tara:strand:- start:281 stop:517 length:237 start_codon:yes stop_codon:yes gene_type:complete
MDDLLDAMREVVIRKYMNQAIELLDYIKEINKSADKDFKLTEDLEHWYGLGILTQDQLIDYLNDRKDGKRMWTTTNNV